ncbi:hypothetical protein [Mariniplasma anaerobium]|uniref:DUF5011 domain-containing protein n=1 Tax=Mariniplasma anaerobium TaxID=2735436 RepID=A0A7U9TIS9_9MOLU|nr:hypothetical protein [Mariniplasma anaerobium]BCR35495.1 hypothetical protein MPAN_003880 [Mariniplasma anaerobium]
MSFFDIFFNFTILLLNVSWFNTEVDLPLDSNIYDYLETVEARIYDDGMLIDDARVSYQFNGVNHSFVSTIKTSYVKTYTLYVEAYFEDYDLKDITILEINVCDFDAPEITYIPTYTINYLDDLPDFTKNVEYIDNYDQNDQLTLSIDTSAINETSIGAYEIIYRISDSSHNESMYTKLFNIVDKTAPTIELIKEITLDVNQAFIVEDFLKVEDNYDANIRLKILDEQVDYDQLGVYEMTVIATDLSRNSSNEIFLVNIVDQSPPDLILKTNPAPISVFSTITEELLKSYILSIADNYDLISVDDVIMTHDIDQTRLGDYHIYYTCSDQSHNTVSQTLEIEVIDDIKPVVEVITPLVFDVFDQDPMMSDYFLITDNYNDFDDLDIKYTYSFDIDEIGRYQIRVEVTDKSKNKTIYLTDASVIDQIPPVITQVSEIIITNFEELDLSIYFNAIDEYDGELTQITIDDYQVDYQKLGAYDIIVSASDLSNNTSFFFTKVHIIDIKSPNLTLSTQKIYLDLDSSMNDEVSYIIDIYDDYDDLSVGDVFIESTIKTDTIGQYELIYTIIDSSLNEFSQKIDVYVDDYTPPNISGFPLYISMYDTIDLLEGLTIDDNIGIYDIYYEPTVLDTSYPGSYEIWYTVLDQRGNKTSFSRMIYIQEIDQSYQINDFIPIIITMISSMSVIYYLYKKM